MNYKAYVFDFDYTLGDSTEGIVQCVNYALQKLGIEGKPTEEIRRTIGLSLNQTYRVLSGDENEQREILFSGYFKQKADEVMVENTKLYPKVKTCMERLKKEGSKIGIVTTKYHYRIAQILAEFGAENLVDVIIGGEDVSEPKPNPEGLLSAIEQLKQDKKEILYVGDSLVDAETAQRAGVTFVGVLTGTTTEEEFERFPRLCIAQSVAELLKK